MASEGHEHETMIPAPAASANIDHQWVTEEGV
jgi:hypothetical protein